MIGGIKILPIPASGHVKTGVETRLAISGWEAVSIISGVACSIAQAGPLNGTLAQLRLRALSSRVLLGTRRGVTSYHLEARGEGLEPRSAVANIPVSTVLIVDQEPYNPIRRLTLFLIYIPTSVRNWLEEFRLWVPEVQLREPVVRKVLRDQTRSAA
jgi:hypothetical protein